MVHTENILTNTYIVVHKQGTTKIVQINSFMKRTKLVIYVFIIISESSGLLVPEGIISESSGLLVPEGIISESSGLLVPEGIISPVVRVSPLT